MAPRLGFSLGFALISCRNKSAFFMRGSRGRPRVTSLLGFFIITGLAVLAGLCLVAVDVGDFTDGLWRLDAFDGLPLRSLIGNR